MDISPLADINPKAVIGKNVRIEAFARIDQDVVIGDGTWIGTNASLYPGARIGRNCSIFPGAVIAAIPQDLKFSGEYSGVEIGDNSTIREYVTVNRATKPGGYTRVGSNTLLMAYSHIGHDTTVGNNCVIVNSVQVAGEVIIQDWAVIGGMSAIHQFCRIGEHAMVSGMSGIVSDVPPYTKVFGIPAKYIGINSIGLKRRGFDKESIDIIRDIYRHVYQNGMNTSQAVEHIESGISQTEETKRIISFIRESERGIVKAVLAGSDSRGQSSNGGRVSVSGEIST